MTVTEALDHARQRFAEANPLSGKLFHEAARVMPGGNTRTVLFHEPFPLRIAAGDGALLRDVDGHEYLDLLGDFTAGLFGHSEPTIAAAVRDALAGGLTLSGHNTYEATLAAGLCARFPAMELVRFTNSGTEANTVAIALATTITERQKVLVFDGAYHGSVLSFGHGGSPLNLPHQWVVGTYNDIADTERLFDEHGAELAAVLVEPMLGSGGCVPGDPAFLTKIQQRAKDVGALLIVDEVMTSRLAQNGRAAELGLAPDLMTVGKYLGGGLTFGAFGGRADLMQRLDPSRPGAIGHPGTFNNNPLSMAAGVAALDLLTPARIQDLSDRGDRLRERLNQIGSPVHASGIGSLLTIHFADGPIRTAADVDRTDPQLRALFHLEMLNEGFVVATRGMVALSLPVTDEQCDAFVQAVERFAATLGTI